MSCCDATKNLMSFCRNHGGWKKLQRYWIGQKLQEWKFYARLQKKIVLSNVRGCGSIVPLKLLLIATFTRTFLLQPCEILLNMGRGSSEIWSQSQPIVGKNFLLTPLQIIFKTFSNPGSIRKQISTETKKSFSRDFINFMEIVMGNT